MPVTAAAPSPWSAGRPRSRGRSPSAARGNSERDDDSSKRARNGRRSLTSSGDLLTGVGQGWERTRPSGAKTRPPGTLGPWSASRSRDSRSLSDVPDGPERILPLDAGQALARLLAHADVVLIA